MLVVGYEFKRFETAFGTRYKWREIELYQTAGGWGARLLYGSPMMMTTSGATAEDAFLNIREMAAHVADCAGLKVRL